MIQPVGHVVGGREEVRDDEWGLVEARIVLDPARFRPGCLAGLESFSHLEVVYHLHRVEPERVETGARRPRNNPAWPVVGIFAQRGKNRPNCLGVSVCRVLGVDGLAIEVRGLDAVDGTPVLDIKPVMSGFLPRGAFREPAWARDIMQHYW